MEHITNYKVKLIVPSGSGDFNNYYHEYTKTYEFKGYIYSRDENTVIEHITSSLEQLPPKASDFLRAILLIDIDGVVWPSDGIKQEAYNRTIAINEEAKNDPEYIDAENFFEEEYGSLLDMGEQARQNEFSETEKRKYNFAMEHLRRSSLIGYL